MARKSLQTTIDDELLKKTKIMAIESNQNVNDIIEKALKLYFEKLGV